MTALPEDVHALFAGPNYAHVATLMPEGGPHSVPVWVGVEAGRIAERLEGDAAWEVIDRISHKYTGGPFPLRTDRVVFLIEPEHAWAQAYG
jgi:Pyridoxamine 5'-phosphate oxidase